MSDASPNISRDPNAVTKEVTEASGLDTFGEVNQHPSTSGQGPSPGQARRRARGGERSGENEQDAGHGYDDDEVEEEGGGVGKREGQGSGFRVGVSVDRNRKCRRTMEDAHSFIYDFGGIRGQGFFAIFDGHAGKHAAEWCGQHFHKHLLNSLTTHPSEPIPSLLNETFQTVDSHLSDLAQTKNLHSGCTAVVCFLRLEDAEGNAVGAGAGVGGAVEVDGKSSNIDISEKRTSGPNEAEAAQDAPGEKRQPNVKITGPAEVKRADKRTLYVGNVGDARAVLSRGGRPVRLSYDHKGSDANEVKRITDAGGFVLNNRVNGVLAVTRALGDSSMKEFVVGAPYTTETVLGPHDEWLIVACDGLWDVCSDEEAIKIVLKAENAQDASQRLLDHALANFSTDNLSVLVVDLQSANRSSPPTGVSTSGRASTEASGSTSPTSEGLRDSTVIGRADR
ncbi:hypothetical protein JCM10212_002609 [Sporobolomyces blumeae]